jgi:asparagine synthase (glutamine-hydrolysing)
LLERLRAASQGSFDARGAHVRALTAPDRVADVELLHPLGGALGVDVRHPFLDRRLVELCLSFPSSQKRRRGFDRYVARNALAALPDAVRWRRTKASFDRAFADWVVGWLAREPVDLRNLGDYVDLPRIAALFARVRRSPEPGAVDFVWRCVVLSRWLYTLGESSAVPSKSEPSSSGSNLAGRLRNEGLGGSPDGSAEPMRA